MPEISRLIHSFASSLNRVNFAHRAGEQSYYPSVKELLESLRENIAATIVATGDADKPDISVYRNQNMIGVVEVKDPSINLDQLEADAQAGKDDHNSEQFRRYLSHFDNVIYTNILQWRLYRQGVLRDMVSLVFQVAGKFDNHRPQAASYENLMAQFLAASPQPQETAEGLALEMARLTRALRDQTKLLCSINNPFLSSLHRVIKKDLVHNLNEKEFSDVYAQTIAYGLFAARVMDPDNGSFSRRSAGANLPKTNPFLRRVYKDLADDDNMPDKLKGIVDDLVELIKAANMGKIAQSLQEYEHKRSLGDFVERDPIIYFYEPFLNAFDPAMRKARGVYYTPVSIVSYLVRAIDDLLVSEFGFENGLADERVIILDPACGTGTFLYEVVRVIYNKLRSRGKAYWSQYVPKLLNRLFGFEYMMAPYTIAHLKIAQYLKDETGFEFPLDKRLGIFLTNTLEQGAKFNLPLLQQLEYWIIDEQNQAADIKTDQKVMVVLGNPPYKGQSVNKNIKWMENSLKIGYVVNQKLNRQGYYTVDGQPLGERNPKWLQDDYVKFLRWAQWRIDRTGYGIVGMITNHGYLDNPTFRGMRQSLLSTFNKMYIRDLHGNSKKKEKAPDGGKDENVFDIQPGVALGIFVKKSGLEGSACTVAHSDLYGKRIVKSLALSIGELNTTTWKDLQPKSPLYLLIPRDESLAGEYEKGWKITDIIKYYSIGIVTARDHLTVQFSPGKVFEVIKDFVSLEPEIARNKYNLGLDARDWKVSFAQKDIKDHGIEEKLIVPVLYRPFDVRYTYYTGRSRGFLCMPRKEIMIHMLRNNLGLITRRQMLHGKPCNYFLVTNKMISDGVIRSDNKGGESLFPLYFYSGSEPQIFNFTEPFKEHIKKHFGPFQPEVLFYYIYAIVYSNIYQLRYSEFLKSDFPRIPLTKNRKYLEKLSSIGTRLVDLHLLKNSNNWPWGDIRQQGNPSALPVPGKVGYDEDNGEIILNQSLKLQDQFRLGPVPKNIWEFRIGGYLVLQHWLAERKGMAINLSEFVPIIIALKETDRIMREEIDPAFCEMMGIP